MKQLHEFLAISGISASSEATGFDVESVLTFDPGDRWEAETYAADQWIKGQIAAAITHLFLAQCNFPAAIFQWNPTDVWTTPAVEINLALLRDEADNRKGFFPVTGTGAGYFRILIAAGQTLDNSEATPAVGNLLIGSAVEMPNVASVAVDLEGKEKVSETFYGGYSADPRGKQRHIISVKFDDDLSVIRAMSKTWTRAVISLDMGHVADAWLVLRPTRWGKPIEHLEQAEASAEYRELV